MQNLLFCLPISTSLSFNENKSTARRLRVQQVTESFSLFIFFNIHDLIHYIRYSHHFSVYMNTYVLSDGA